MLMIFFIHVFLRSKLCPSLLDNISLRVPTRNVRNYNQLFPSRKNCHSAVCAAAANLLCCDIDIFCKDIKSLKDVKGLHHFLDFLLFSYCVVGYWKEFGITSPVCT